MNRTDFLSRVVLTLSAMLAIPQGAAAGGFTETGNLFTQRAWDTATLLSSGKVLVAGGNRGFGSDLASAELYDPATGMFAPTGSLLTGRTYASATLLQDGKVLIAGNLNEPSYINSAELYDPTTGTFAATGSMATAHAYGTAIRLSNG